MSPRAVRRPPIVETNVAPRYSCNLLTLGAKELALAEGRKLTIRGKVGEGDLCTLYEGSILLPPTESAAPTGGTRFSRILDDDDDPPETSILLKVCKNELDNDLVQGEVSSLGTLYPEGTVEEKFYRYLPRSFGGFNLDGFQTSIITRYTGYLTLAEIIKAYPAGIDYRDMAWMFRRALEVLGFVHGKGFVHGAILPPHILVHPVQHGARLIDWSYAVTSGRIRAMCADYEDLYAPEIFDRQDAKWATDIYMLAKCMVALLGGDPKTNAMKDEVPKPVQDLLLQCLDPAPTMRLTNAWDIHEVFDKILEDLTGRPRYREFKMPEKS